MRIAGPVYARYGSDMFSLLIVDACSFPRRLFLQQGSHCKESELSIQTKAKGGQEKCLYSVQTHRTKQSKTYRPACRATCSWTKHRSRAGPGRISQDSRVELDRGRNQRERFYSETAGKEPIGLRKTRSLAEKLIVCQKLEH